MTVLVPHLDCSVLPPSRFDASVNPWLYLPDVTLADLTWPSTLPPPLDSPAYSEQLPQLLTRAKVAQTSLAPLLRCIAFWALPDDATLTLISNTVAESLGKEDACRWVPGAHSAGRWLAWLSGRPDDDLIQEYDRLLNAFIVYTEACYGRRDGKKRSSPRCVSQLQDEMETTLSPLTEVDTSFGTLAIRERGTYSQPVYIRDAPRGGPAYARGHLVVSLEDDLLSLTPAHAYSNDPGSRAVYVACKWDALIGMPQAYMCEAINEAQDALQAVFLESMH